MHIYIYIYIYAYIYIYNIYIRILYISYLCVNLCVVDNCCTGHNSVTYLASKIRQNSNLVTAKWLKMEQKQPPL